MSMVPVGLSFSATRQALMASVQQKSSGIPLMRQMITTGKPKTMTKTMRSINKEAADCEDEQVFSSEMVVEENKTKPAALCGSTAQRAISSMCFTKLLEYLSQSQAIQMQQLSRFFYHVQLPRCQAVTIKVASSCYRLHLLN